MDGIQEVCDIATVTTSSENLVFPSDKRAGNNQQHQQVLQTSHSLTGPTDVSMLLSKVGVATTQFSNLHWLYFLFWSWVMTLSIRMSVLKSRAEGADLIDGKGLGKKSRMDWLFQSHLAAGHDPDKRIMSLRSS